MATIANPFLCGMAPTRWPEQAARFDNNGLALLLVTLPNKCTRSIARQHARVALRHVLSSLTGLFEKDVMLRDTVSGPVLENDKNRIYISLSYLDDLCLLGLAQDRPVGVDIVRIEPLHEIESLARLYLPEASCRAVMTSEAAVRDENFALAWAEMEACSKCLGLPLDEISHERERALNECEICYCLQTSNYRIALATNLSIPKKLKTTSAG